KNVLSICGYDDIVQSELLNNADIAERRKDRIYSMTSIAPLTKENEASVQFHYQLANTVKIPINNHTKDNLIKTEPKERKMELERIRKDGGGFRNINDMENQKEN